VAILAGLAALTGASVRAEEPHDPPRSSHNNFGMTGLIDTPTADMQPDAQVSLSSAYFGGNVRTTLSAQFLPWVEASFRYSFIDNFAVDGSSTFDRSFDVKLRLIAESERWPAVAIGLQDFLGTGILSGEYVVATKGFDTGGFGHLRVSGGIGWGRFASGGGVWNPFRAIDPAFGSRPGFDGGGGEVNFGQFFRGREMGFFGGVEWLTPIEGLSLKLEYSNDDYRRERRNGGFTPEIPLNVGAEYRLTDGIEIGAYYMYGSEFGVRLSISGNPFRPLADFDAERAPQPLLPREPLPNGALIAGLGEVRTTVAAAPVKARFSDPRLGAVTVHVRLGSVRWADAVLTRDADQCPDDLAHAIDAEYGVIDAVTFKLPGGNVLCTVALRPAGEHAVRIASRTADHYPTDWYEDEATREEIARKLVDQLDADQIGLHGVEIGPRRVAIYIENRRYQAGARAIGRTARILTRTMPPSVEVFEITPIENSLAISTIVLRRSQLEDQADRPDASHRAWTTAEVVEAGPVPWGDFDTPGAIEYPRFSWSLSPVTPANLFDPDQPVRFDLALVGGATVELTPGFTVNAAVSKRLVGQLDDITRASDSLVENRVRSDIAQYLREGDPALLRLSADYVTKISDSVYGRVSAGLLERMYGGVSAEVLWKPVDQSWGMGLEVNWVKQRDFDTRLTFRDYDVVTGHASLYWNTGFYGLFAQVDAGRYLAGDWGGTFTLKRRFANGWEFGGFFTLTDIPFSEFGEGSFDKGLFLTIPFNWAVPFETRGSYSLLLRPLTRDGGQRLEVSNRLWSTVESVDQPHIRSGWQDFWE
jgi:hypothetical protein